MRQGNAILFLAIALSIYGLINFYVFRRGWAALSGTGKVRLFYLAFFLLAALSYPLGRFGERLERVFFFEFLVRIGSFYLAAMLYFLLFVLLIGLIRIVSRIIRIFPSFPASHSQRAGQVTFLAVLILTAIILTIGYFHATRFRIRTLEVTLDKEGSVDALNIVVASDIHLGTTNGSARLKKIVQAINSLAPDVVFLPGDTVDEDVPPLEEEKMVEALKQIRSKFGIFAVTGNHEYYGGAGRNIYYLRKAQIRVLQDEAVKIGESFYIIGRKDRTALRFGESRKSLAQILAEGQVNQSLPVFLLDHQPLELEEAERERIDFQFSGHTHAGQLFPLNLINKKIYEINWGYLRKGRTHYYVSCGVGTWGPPVRTGSVSEIVNVRIKFKIK